MAANNFPAGGAGESVESPATVAVAVTKSDTTLLDPVPRALYIGGGGDVVVDTLGGQTNVTFTAVPTGVVLPIRAIRVKVATTATAIVGLS